jgi:hypothetical protein
MFFGSIICYLVTLCYGVAYAPLEMFALSNDDPPNTSSKLGWTNPLGYLAGVASGIYFVATGWLHALQQKLQESQLKFACRAERTTTSKLGVRRELQFGEKRGAEAPQQKRQKRYHLVRIPVC